MRCLHGRHLDNPARFAEAARRVDYKKTDRVQKRLHLVRTALCEQARLRIVQALGAGELSVGDLAIAIESARPATSQHLRVLRENGFATVRAEGARRMYAVDPAPLREVDVWLEGFRWFWNQRLDALGTELARGKRERRTKDDTSSSSDGASNGKDGEDA